MKNIFSTSVLTMSPLITFLVIMLLTVVYNESQFVTDYQDLYEKALAKNSMPFELCDSSTKRKLCERSNIWRQFLKKVDNSHDDGHDYSHEYLPDYYDDEDIRNTEVRNIGQKRNFAQNKIVHQDIFNCATVKTHVDLGKGYYPRIIGNITCEHTSSESSPRICSRGWNCQPVKYMTRVLAQHTLREKLPSDAPEELKGCWLFEEIPIHVGCKCGRSF